MNDVLSEVPFLKGALLTGGSQKMLPKWRPWGTKPLLTPASCFSFTRAPFFIAAVKLPCSSQTHSSWEISQHSLATSDHLCLSCSFLCCELHFHFYSILSPLYFFALSSYFTFKKWRLVLRNADIGNAM